MTEMLEFDEDPSGGVTITTSNAGPSSYSGPSSKAPTFSGLRYSPRDASRYVAERAAQESGLSVAVCRARFREGWVLYVYPDGEGVRWVSPTPDLLPPADAELP